MNCFKLLPILTLTAIGFAPTVLARSLSIDDKHAQLLDPNISSVESPMDIIAHWLKAFPDGKPDPDQIIGVGSSARDWNFDDGQTSPENRGGGGSRGDCPLEASHLTALIPKTNLGKTVDGHPTFWFYVPDNAQMVSHAKFTLLDGETPVLYEHSIPLSGTPGLVSVTLPSTAKELEIGKEYHWFFELECDENSDDNPRVDGWVERVAPIPGIEPDDYIAYAEEGIWYNALTPLAQMRQQDEQNPTLQNDWLDLLKAVELESLVDISIADCCDDMKRANRL